LWRGAPGHQSSVPMTAEAGKPRPRPSRPPSPPSHPLPLKPAGHVPLFCAVDPLPPRPAAAPQPVDQRGAVGVQVPNALHPQPRVPVAGGAHRVCDQGAAGGGPAVLRAREGRAPRRARSPRAASPWPRQVSPGADGSLHTLPRAELESCNSASTQT
jgi:hypothetical protein